MHNQKVKWTLIIVLLLVGATLVPIGKSLIDRHKLEIVLSSRSKPIVLNRVSFDGQQRSLVLLDPISLEYLSRALSGASGNSMGHGGIGYSVTLDCDGLGEVKTYIIINDNKSEINVAGPGAGGPFFGDDAYHQVVLSIPIPPKFSEAINYLLASPIGVDNANKTIN